MDKFILYFYIKYIFVVIIAVSFFYACNSEDVKYSDVIENEYDTEVGGYVDKSNNGNSTKVYTVNRPSIIFFKLDKDEYDLFIKRSGKYAKYDFDIIFNDFDRIADATQRVSVSKKFNVVKTDASKYVFLSNKKDTFYFNRIEKDMIIGTIFFRGDTMPFIEQGLMDRVELREKIMKYFRLETFEELKVVLPERNTNVILIEDSASLIVNDTIN